MHPSRAQANFALSVLEQSVCMHCCHQFADVMDEYRLSSPEKFTKASQLPCIGPNIQQSASAAHKSQLLVYVSPEGAVDGMQDANTIKHQQDFNT